MRLPALRRHWDAFGKSDPLWAILTAPDKKGNRWSIDEFLATGRDQIAALIGYLDSHGLATRRRRALDFGCGAGRLTHALADHFDEVIGVDIAPSMIDIARRLHAGVTNAGSSSTRQAGWSPSSRTPSIWCTQCWSCSTWRHATSGSTWRSSSVS
jgi:SAM-dependent methyltransferase